MCVVSNVGDFYRDAFPKQWPAPAPWEIPAGPSEPQVSKSDFDRLKKQVDEMMDLLRKAKEIDTKTGQPDCEMDEKLELLRKIAKTVGVDLGAALK